MERPLSEAQQQEAQELAAALAQAAQEDLLHIAQTLVGAGDAVFGDTEFQVREAILRVAAKAYEQHLARKKTATSAPA
jgi:hypothetical protein